VIVSRPSAALSGMPPNMTTEEVMRVLRHR
jgi:hypothetical protein